LFKQRSDGFGFALLFIHNTAGNSIKQPKHNLICPTVSFSQVLKIASGVTIVPAWVMARGGRLLAVQGQRRLETTLYPRPRQMPVSSNCCLNAQTTA